MKYFTGYSFLILIMFFANCEPEVEIGTDPDSDPSQQEWFIPKSEILSRSEDHSGVQSLVEPAFTYASGAEFLDDNDYVLGFKAGNEFRAYPRKILNYHEVVNDVIGIQKIAISYCPMSGTGIAWDRNFNGFEFVFDVSEYIYQSNLILVEQKSVSHWQQMISQCVNGNESFYRKRIDYLQVIETTWSNWKTMFPSTKVLSDDTGFDFDYNINPYRDYENSDDIIYNVRTIDKRLPLKERVHGIIVDDHVMVYRFSNFENELSMIADNFQGLSIVVVGSSTRNFIVSFERQLQDGTELNFTINTSAPNIILEDDEGNIWDVFGLAVDGPRKGQTLTPTQSYMGYWFVWPAMFEDPLIHK